MMRIDIFAVTAQNAPGDVAVVDTGADTGADSGSDGFGETLAALGQQQPLAEQVRAVADTAANVAPTPAEADVAAAIPAEQVTSDADARPVEASDPDDDTAGTSDAAATGAMVAGLMERLFHISVTADPARTAAVNNAAAHWSDPATARAIAARQPPLLATPASEAVSAAPVGAGTATVQPGEPAHVAPSAAPALAAPALGSVAQPLASVGAPTIAPQAVPDDGGPDLTATALDVTTSGADAAVARPGAALRAASVQLSVDTTAQGGGSAAPTAPQDDVSGPSSTAGLHAAAAPLPAAPAGVVIAPTAGAPDAVAQAAPSQIDQPANTAATLAQLGDGPAGSRIAVTGTSPPPASGSLTASAPGAASVVALATPAADGGTAVPTEMRVTVGTPSRPDVAVPAAEVTPSATPATVELSAQQAAAVALEPTRPGATQRSPAQPAEAQPATAQPGADDSLPRPAAAQPTLLQAAPAQTPIRQTAVAQPALTQAASPQMILPPTATADASNTRRADAPDTPAASGDAADGTSTATPGVPPSLHATVRSAASDAARRAPIPAARPSVEPGGAARSKAETAGAADAFAQLGAVAASPGDPAAAASSDTGVAQLTGLAMSTVGQSLSAAVGPAPVSADPAGAALAAVDPQAVARQLAEAVSQQPDRPIELRLSPDELGPLRLTLQTTGDGITVTVRAERSETADLLRRHIDILAQEFRDIGYSDVAFSFADRQQPDRRSDADLRPNDPRDADEHPLVQPAATLPAARPAAGGLDLRL